MVTWSVLSIRTGWLRLVKLNLPIKEESSWVCRRMDYLDKDIIFLASCCLAALLVFTRNSKLDGYISIYESRFVPVFYVVVISEDSTLSTWTFFGLIWARDFLVEDLSFYSYSWASLTVLSNYLKPLILLWRLSLLLLRRDGDPDLDKLRLRSWLTLGLVLMFFFESVSSELSGFERLVVVSFLLLPFRGLSGLKWVKSRKTDFLLPEFGEGLPKSKLPPKLPKLYAIIDLPLFRPTNLLKVILRCLGEFFFSISSSFIFSLDSRLLEFLEMVSL